MIETTYSYNGAKVGSKFTAKVFAYMFMALIITGVVAAVIGYIFSTLYPIQYGSAVSESASKAYLILLLVSIFTYIPVLIWIQVRALKGKGGVFVPYIIYAVLMGVIISNFTMLIPFYLIAMAFGLTALAFGIMFLIGYFAKRDLSALAVISFGLMTGIAIIGLFNLIWMLVFPGTFQMFYWIVTYGFFAVIILLTIFDMQNVKKLAQSGETDKNVALLCALNLYVDFIYIFIRLLVLLVRIFGNNR